MRPRPAHWRGRTFARVDDAEEREAEQAPSEVRHVADHKPAQALGVARTIAEMNPEMAALIRGARRRPKDYRGPNLDVCDLDVKKIHWHHAFVDESGIVRTRRYSALTVEVVAKSEQGRGYLRWLLTKPENLPAKAQNKIRLVLAAHKERT